MKSAPYIFFAAVLFACGLSAGGANANGVRAKDDPTFIIGRVTADARKSQKKISPMGDYLAKHLRDFGVSRAAVRLARSNREMIELLRRGEVDLISETPFSAFFLAAHGGGEIILREWKKGKASYYTVFIARKDSPIATLADLRGKKIVFEDPGSTSAFLVPFAILRERGFEMVELASPDDWPPAGKGGYVFGREELNISFWVSRGIAHAGAFSNHDWLSRTHENVKKDLKVIYRTKSITRSVVLVRRGLEARRKQRIKEVLLRMDKSPEGKKVLKKYYKVGKYDEFEGEAAEHLAAAREIYANIPPNLMR
jgi:phosphonate transport system substrate-binding protein